MNKFESLIKFLIIYNELAVYSEVTWEIINGRLYIDGNPKQLATLMTLLWSSTKEYCFYFTNRNNSSMLEVIEIKEVGE